MVAVINKVLLAAVAVLAIAGTSCSAVLIGYQTYQIGKCHRAYGSIPTFTTILQPDAGANDHSATYKLPDASFLPSDLQKNYFEVTLRGATSWTLSSYRIDKSTPEGNYVISFRHPSGRYLSSWYLANFDSCDLDQLDTPLWHGFTSIVLTKI